MPSLFAKKEPTTPKPRTPKVEPKRLPVTEKACQAVVLMVNFVYAVTPWRDDALDDDEVEMLTKNLHKMAKKNIYLGNFIVNLTTGAAEGQFVAAVGAVVTLRLAKHNQIPPLQGVMVSGLLRGIAMTDPEVVADAVGAGEPRGPDRLDGDRKDNVAGSPPEPQEIRDSLAHQAGYASLAEVSADQSGGPDQFFKDGTRWISPTITKVSPGPARHRVPKSPEDGLPPGGLDGGN